MSKIRKEKKYKSIGAGVLAIIIGFLLIFVSYKVVQHNQAIDVDKSKLVLTVIITALGVLVIFGGLGEIFLNLRLKACRRKARMLAKKQIMTEKMPT